MPVAAAGRGQTDYGWGEERQQADGGGGQTAGGRRGRKDSGQAAQTDSRRGGADRQQRVLSVSHLSTDKLPASPWLLTHSQCWRRGADTTCTTTQRHSHSQTQTHEFYWYVRATNVYRLCLKLTSGQTNCTHDLQSKTTDTCERQPLNTLFALYDFGLHLLLTST